MAIQLSYTSSEIEELLGQAEKIGDLDDLETTDKTDLVAAINEAAQSGGSTGTTVPAEVRQAILTLFESAAYASADVSAAITTVRSWAMEITAIEISQSAISISGSNTVQLTATTTPAGGTVAWTSSDTAVATVSSSGLVTGVGNGTATITARCGDLTATCTATVSGFSTLTGITATYTQSSAVYATSSLSDLTSDLVVVARYDDSSTVTLTSNQYTLSGTLAVGTSTITVSYGGMTDTFNVTVSTAPATPIYNWDLKTSLTDTVGGITAVLTNATQGADGVTVPTNGAIMLTPAGGASIANRTIEIDVASDEMTGSAHARIFSVDSADVATPVGAACVLVYRGNNGWAVYTGSAWSASLDKTTYPITMFDQKTIRLYVDSSLNVTLSYADIGSSSFTEIGTFDKPLTSTYESGYFVVGGTSGNYTTGLIVSGVRIYEGDISV